MPAVSLSRFLFIWLVLAAGVAQAQVDRVREAGRTEQETEEDSKAPAPDPAPAAKPTPQGPVVLRGIVLDAETGDPLVGATVYPADKSTGAYTDDEGRFELRYKGTFPLDILAQYVGFDTLRVTVPAPTEDTIRFELSNSSLEVIEIQGSRISDKIRENPQTVERMDVIMVKETPQANFYDGLGALKGVDVTAVSLGFKVINTRGFNSTNPVRSLQVIDGFDNASPGLNFALGNLGGSSELDILGVDVIQGASGAAYGPGAFNGVIAMETKDPFLYPGVAAQVKYGERNLFETSVRYAHVIQNRKGKDKFAFKINASLLRADDWEADNFNPTDQSLVGVNNFGGYDAVNIYGDEPIRRFNNFIVGTQGGNESNTFGLGVVHRTGYREVDIVDYNARNIKLAAEGHFKFTDDIRLMYGYNFANGTSVYQGDNRFSIKDLYFYQHRLKLSGPNWYVMSYYTGEDAGKSYDAVLTAQLLQQRTYGGFTDPLTDTEFGRLYADRFWQTGPDGPGGAPGPVDIFRNTPGFPDINGNPSDAQDAAATLAWLAAHPSLVAQMHADARAFVEGPIPDRFNPSQTDFPARLVPGTPEFDAEFRRIISTPPQYVEDDQGVQVNLGGSRLVDRSTLFHTKAEYYLNPKDNAFMPKWLGLRVGARFRYYMPESDGIVFSDTLRFNPEDSTFTREEIRLWETGAYLLGDLKFMRDRIKINFAFRADRSQNFDWVFSPQASFVYTTANRKHNFRLNGSAAVRNPTLLDQYQFYNVGIAVLRGNLDGIDSVVTLEDAFDFLDGQVPNPEVIKAQAFNIAPLVPEQVQTVEVGYKGNLVKNLFVDASYYFSWYQNFIGFNLITPVTEDRFVGNQLVPEVFRYTANAQDAVTTQGFSIGGSYFFKDFYSLTGNYTWTVLNSESDDPIIPAYNTPAHKFNVGISARDIQYKNFRWKHWGFGVSARWVQGYQFEGSPQFTGRIPTYWTIDAQLNYTVPKWYTTFKAGASNLLDREYFQAYGGPQIGRLAYVSVLFELDTRK